ncbi:MAG: protein phosphatase 2C domain-containing protein [Sphingomicrobium sp.]
MGFECVSRTDVGLRRKINEDALLVRTPRGLWAVADGMGGHDAGEVASAMVTEALAKLHPVENIDHYVAEAVAALGEVNTALIALAGGDGGGRTIGSTVVGLAIRGREYRCFWAGDSRAYRLRGGGLVQLSRDHSLVQDLVDTGMITPAEALHHPNANVITRAVGVKEGLEVDIASGDVRPGDLFLLASDGLTRVVEDAEIAAELTRAPPAEAANRLVAMVLARGAPDNVTLVIVSVS